MRGEVVVTGIGVVSPLGDSAAALHQALVAGRTAFAPVTAFPVDGAGAHHAAEVAGFDPARYLGDANFRPLDRTGLLAACAARLALEDAGWTGGAEPGGELALVLGTMYGSVRTIAEFDRRGIEAGPLYVKPFDFANSVINAAAGQTAIWHRLRGPNSTVSTGNTSGVQALALAADLVSEGRAAVALAGGAEELCFESFVAFARAGALAPDSEPPRPFDAGRRGFALGEGAAFLVLESAAGAAARGARVLARVLGHGSAFDASQGCDAASGARAVSRAVRLALGDAGVAAADVDAVSAAASGHLSADRAEAAGLADALGPRAATVALTAPKGAFGECLGASGGLQAAALVTAMLAGELSGVPGLAAREEGFALAAARAEPVRGELALGLVSGVGLDGPRCAVVLAAGGAAS
jgi:3-oxoacyl-[acyl-carrier-protein] synthase II